MTDEQRPRPRWHLAPERFWMNDPNGLVHDGGVWHAFFQCNPSGTTWANMSWGHASSPDLASWTEHPVALPSVPGEDVFSGSVVVAPASVVAGWPDPPSLGDATDVLVAVYTSAWTRGSARFGTQSQSLATSVDGGETWRRYARNPVLDRGSASFRDPKVFPHDGGWVLVAVEATERQVLLFRSDDLVTWTPLSTFGPAHPAEGVWECPDLVRLPVEGGDRAAWLLLLSIGEGASASVQGTYGIIGDFDGTTFTPLEPPRPAWVLDRIDHGPDFYAAVTFANVADGRAILLGWMNNWIYAKTVPLTGGRSAMSLPRELSLVERGGRLVLRQRLARELVGVVDTLTTTLHEGDALTVRGLTLGLASGLLTVSRPGDPGISPDYGLVVSAEVGEGPVDVEVYTDSCSVEVSAHDGLVWLTALAF